MTALSLSIVWASVVSTVQVVELRTGAVVAETDGALTLAVPPGEYLLRSSSGDERVTVATNTSVSSPASKVVLVDGAAANVARAEAEVLPKRLEASLGVSYVPADAFVNAVGFSTAFSWRFSRSFAWRAMRVMYQVNFETGLQQMLQREFGVLPTAFGSHVEWMGGSDLVATLWRSGVINGFQLEVAAALGPSVATVWAGASRRAGVGGTAELWMNVQLPLARDLSLRVGASDDVLVQQPFGGPLNTFRLCVAATWRFGAAD